MEPTCTYCKVSVANNRQANRGREKKRGDHYKTLIKVAQIPFFCPEAAPIESVHCECCLHTELNQIHDSSVRKRNTCKAVFSKKINKQKNVNVCPQMHARYEQKRGFLCCFFFFYFIFLKLAIWAFAQGCIGRGAPEQNGQFSEKCFHWSSIWNVTV